MTTLTLRRIKDHFVVTGPDIEPTSSHDPKAGTGCKAHPGLPITEIGRNASRRVMRWPREAAKGGVTVE